MKLCWPTRCWAPLGHRVRTVARVTCIQPSTMCAYKFQFTDSYGTVGRDQTCNYFIWLAGRVSASGIRLPVWLGSEPLLQRHQIFQLFAYVCLCVYANVRNKGDTGKTSIVITFTSECIKIKSLHKLREHDGCAKFRTACQ